VILATVITCPARWAPYQRLRRNFSDLNFPFALRTFQNPEGLGNPRVNNNLNARAALAYADRHLPDSPDSWLLYLEDDVVLRPALPAVLPELVALGRTEEVDCWFLCNRRNPVKAQFRLGSLRVNELAYPFEGAHGLLFPKRHLRTMLATHWTTVSDREMFEAIRHPGLKVLQVIEPVLVEHVGLDSTFGPGNPEKFQFNHANPSNPGAPL
jgi:hypothetical protein